MAWLQAIYLRIHDIVTRSCQQKKSFAKPINFHKADYDTARSTISYKFYIFAISEHVLVTPNKTDRLSARFNARLSKASTEARLLQESSDRK